MLTIGETPRRTCDGVGRHELLQAGGAGLLGMSLPQVLAAARIGRHFLVLLTVALSLCLPALPVAAIGGPENVALVVNAESWSSTRLANEYVRLRRIPAANVIYLDGLADLERMDVETFRQKILLPVLKTIETRGLARQIDAVVYSSDFPTTIDVRRDIGDRKLPPVLTPDAAINGLTYLYPLVLSKDIRYLDFQANLYARRLVNSSTDSKWTEAEQQRYGEAQRKASEVQRTQRERTKQRAEAKPAEKNSAPKEEPKRDDPTVAQQLAKDREVFAECAAVLAELRQGHPRSTDLLYNLACLEALLERFDDALKTLAAAVDNGWFDHRHAQADSDLRGLREREEFKQLLERMKQVQPKLQPLQAFRGAYGWSATGDAQPPTAGPRYLVSTMLSVTAGRGLSVTEGVNQLRRSAAADGTRPRGTIYFPHNGDVRSTTREWGFRPAASAIETLGIRTVVEPGVLPQGKSDVAGAVIGTAGFEWSKSGSTILPGAICEHLTSFGGMLGQDAGQTPLTEFLRHGAAGASGTVTEPYAIQAKFPTPYVQWAYANGFTLGEAFYQAVSGPYQLLIVGDVLCRPWGVAGSLKVEGFPADGVARGMLTLTPSVDTLVHQQRADEPPQDAKPAANDAEAKLALGPVVFDLYVDGRLAAMITEGKSFAFDTDPLADGPHEFTIVAQRETASPLVGRSTTVVEVRQQGARLMTSGPPAGEVRWDRPIELQAKLAGATEIVFSHNGRVVGKIAGAEGTVTIAPGALGAGPVRVLSTGRIGPREVAAAPLDFVVVAPPALAAQTLAADQQLHDGLLLKVGEQPPVVVTDAKPDWLAKAGVAKPTPWTLEGWFQVPAEDIYQIQLEGNATGVRVLVDDQVLDWPRGAMTWHLPVHLASGAHRLKIESTESHDPPKLGIRFGGPGTRWLEGTRFRHAK